MKVVKTIVGFFAPPVMAVIILFFFDLAEPLLRSLLGIPQATEDSPLSPAIGFAMFFVAFFILNALFILLNLFIRKFGRPTLFAFLYSMMVTLFAAGLLHAPQTGEKFYQTMLVSMFLVGIPLFVGEVITKVILRRF